MSEKKSATSLFEFVKAIFLFFRVLNFKFNSCMSFRNMINESKYKLSAFDRLKVRQWKLIKLVSITLICFSELFINSSQNAKASWYNLSSGTTSEIWAMQFLNDYSGFFAGAGGLIKKTTDGGLS